MCLPAARTYIYRMQDKNVYVFVYKVLLMNTVTENIFAMKTYFSSHNTYRSARVRCCHIIPSYVNSFVFVPDYCDAYFRTLFLLDNWREVFLSVQE